jgi:hypothetical protein
MRKIILLSLILTSSLLLKSQINAVTETGDEVILYNDGTWKYLNNISDEEKQIPVNQTKYFKDEKSTFLVKSKKLNVGIWINPKSWSFKKGTDEDAGEFVFEKKGEDLYAMLISEKVEIPIPNLIDIAFENAKSASPDVRVVKKEYRNVNGVQVLMMQMAGTIQGIRFTYYGYYYSNSNGTIQLLTYTSESLFNDYLDEIELFLNGFVEL